LLFTAGSTYYGRGDSASSALDLNLGFRSRTELYWNRTFDHGLDVECIGAQLVCADVSADDFFCLDRGGLAQHGYYREHDRNH